MFANNNMTLYNAIPCGWEPDYRRFQHCSVKDRSQSGTITAPPVLIANGAETDAAETDRVETETDHAETDGAETALFAEVDRTAGRDPCWSRRPNLI